VDLLDERVLAAGGTGQGVAEVRMWHELALTQAGSAIVTETVDAGDVLRGAGEDQNCFTAKNGGRFGQD